jgi:hypothetical protein
MATLSVLKFDDPRAAARTLIALQGMQGDLPSAPPKEIVAA